MSSLATKSGLNLVREYLDVCNAASEAHRHTLPYKPIIAAYDSIFAKRQVGVDIYESDPAEIETTVTIRLRNDNFEVVPETEADPSFHLKLKRSYMEDVVAHREEYIRHPEKLDWDWIKSRIGIEALHSPVHGANMRPPKKPSAETPAKGADMRPRSARRK